jgi:hypothetical protein
MENLKHLVTVNWNRREVESFESQMCWFVLNLQYKNGVVA